jgi:hypothetical protein
MLTHEELKKQMLNRPDVKAEYDALEKEFTLFDELLMDRLEDIELAEIVREREGQSEIEVDINDL